MADCEFDLTIAGAGPAGCTLALNMAPKGYRIAIIEKEVFPRPKICGGALSGQVINVMKRLPGGVYEDFVLHVDKIPSWGIRFISPDHQAVDIPFLLHKKADQPAPGFVCNRNDFDGFLFRRLQEYPNIQVFQGEPVSEIIVEPGYAVAKTKSREFIGKVIAGADGVHSTVRRILQAGMVEKKHFSVGIRCYYENVAGLHPENFIELIFLKRLLPGYFWIFPSPGGLVNAGFGMLQSRINDRRVNMHQILQELITEHPLISPRFTNAKPVGKPGAHMLPLGTCRSNYSGTRFILLGDAAFLVDPFTGEGIGNAMASGEIAAAVLGEAFGKNDFSGESMKSYDARINRRFAREFRTMSAIQRLSGSAWLFNYVVGKARKNKDVSELLTTMYTNDAARKKLTNVRFYTGLLFK